MIGLGAVTVTGPGWVSCGLGKAVPGRAAAARELPARHVDRRPRSTRDPRGWQRVPVLGGEFEFGAVQAGELTDFGCFGLMRSGAAMGTGPRGRPEIISSEVSTAIWASPTRSAVTRSAYQSAGTPGGNDPDNTTHTTFALAPRRTVALEPGGGATTSRQSVSPITSLSAAASTVAGVRSKLATVTFDQCRRAAHSASQTAVPMSARAATRNLLD